MKRNYPETIAASIGSIHTAMTFNCKFSPLWSVGFAAFVSLTCVFADTPAQPPQPVISVVNVDPAELTDVAQAAGSLGYQLAKSSPKVTDHSEKMVFLEVTSRGGGGVALTPDAVTHWMDYVQNGGRLLVSIDRTSLPDLMRLGPMLPTMAWRATQDVLGPNTLAETDPDFFPNATAVAGFTVPFYFPIRPWLAVERGQARYDKFDRPMSRQDEKTILPAGTEWWTRPLINREWTIRARGSDVAASPLLLTGRYGAGRVAVFASSLTDASGPQAQAFWTQVIKWLGQDEPATGPVVQPANPLDVQVSGEPSKEPRTGIQASLIALASGTGNLLAPPALNTTSPGNLVVSIRNPNSEPMKVKIVARLLSWEHAMVDDRLTDATLPGNGVVTQIKLPLPVPSAISYQEIEARPAFDVRLGVLTEDGSKLLSETKTTIDLTPPVAVAVHTEEIRTIPFPFAIAARPDKKMQDRNGMPVYSCAYLSGATVQATVDLSNGVRNIASLATITDVDEPTNPSVGALNTGATGDRVPDWFLPSTWTFFQTDNGSSVTFKLSFPKPVTVTGVTLWGMPDGYRNNDRKNPEQAVISQDGKELARESNLTDRFKTETGQVRIPFKAVKLQEFTITLTKPDSKVKNPMVLGQIEVEGSDEPAPAPVHGKVCLLLTNGLTGEVQRIHTEDVTLGSFEQKSVKVPVMLPSSPDAQFYRLDGVFLGDNGAPNATNGFTLMTVSGKEPVLQSLDSLEDMDFASGYPKGASLGFIVTRGFRNVFDNAVGTAEVGAGWGQPDDLVWAYAHGFKQEGRPKTQANRLYVASTDMRHYSTPWRQFYNSEEFYDIATPLLVNRMKEEKSWSNSDLVTLGHSDRWDTGPSIGANHTWQDFEGFNSWLLAHQQPGLTGHTLPELTAEIASDALIHPWFAWQMERYVANVRNLRDSFAKEGKRLLLTAQGAPVMPLSAAGEIDSVIRGCSDDNTWGEAASDLLFTTGRQMGAVALNPTLSMATLNEWQWLSGILGNFQWRGAVGTTEPARRHQYDRAFRGTLRPDGGYGAMSVYGYNNNGGSSYTLNELDYNQWEQTQIKQSLLYPSAPIGAGLIISNAKYDKPENVQFDCDEGNTFPEAHLVQDAVQRLGYAGISISFCGNASLLDGWKNQAPLILLNLPDFSDAEQKTVLQMAAAGRPLVVFQSAGTSPLSATTAALFGVKTDGTVADGQVVAKIQDHDVVKKGNCLYVPVKPGDMSQEEANNLAPILRQALAQVITFPSGTTGYGFVSNGRNFAVVEDWREEGRVADLRVRADSHAKALLAVDTNDNRPLETTKDGADWVIHLPLRPGDASLVAFKEVTP
jgi:hypothetical protein